jgi:hypothetical protein
MVEGQVGQPPSAVLDQDLRAYQVEEEQPDHPTILGQYSIKEVRQRKQQF